MVGPREKFWFSQFYRKVGLTTCSVAAAPADTLRTTSQLLMARSDTSTGGSDDEQGFGAVFDVRPGPSSSASLPLRLPLSRTLQIRETDARHTQEPEGFRPVTPPPTVRTYARRALPGAGVGPLIGNETVQVGLVSGHPLWGQSRPTVHGPPEGRLNFSLPVFPTLRGPSASTGHVLYPAAIALARFLELHAEQLLHSPDGKGRGKGKGKAVLELGAGGGLPGLVAALEGAGDASVFSLLSSACVSPPPRD